MKKTHFLTLVLILLTKMSFAQNGYIGEIRLFAGNFEIAGWAYCNGQLLSIAENDALFNLIGTTYGGDGVNTFAVPDLRSRIPVGSGTGPGLTSRTIGQSGGTETVTLSVANLPAHTHQSQLQVNDQNATLAIPTATSSIATAGSLSGRVLRQNLNYNTTAPDITIQNVTTSNTGASQPQSISIVKPYLGLNYIISLYGIYPSQN
jgi:microcystin-dependent protein